MRSIGDKSKCTGCKACEMACPVHAITMVSDEHGFWYPSIDSEKCIDCGMCDRVCHYQHVPVTTFSKSAYAVYNKDEDIVRRSSSGGVFYLIARSVIDMGGYVFGAKFDEDMRLIYASTNSLEGLSDLMGSKYVQGDTMRTFVEVKKLLDEGQQVLFVGTPCHVNGLKTYLRLDYANLILVDFVCHGVPSPMIFDRYLNSKDKENITHINFRDKGEIWSDFAIKIDYKDGTSYRKSSKEDEYMQAFGRDLSLRPSCYSCLSKGNNRASDITIADFWGASRVCPEMNNSGGLSLVIVNSDVGCGMMNAISSDIVSKKMDVDIATSGNKSYGSSAVKPSLYDKFFDMASKGDMDKAVKSCATKPSLILRLKVRLKNMLSKH